MPLGRDDRHNLCKMLVYVLIVEKNWEKKMVITPKFLSTEFLSKYLPPTIYYK